METHWDVIVVGAGLAGLAAAATAAGAGASVLVLDGQRPGGRATTDERGGYRLNRGAHAFYRGGAGRGVLDRLGVTVRGDSPILDGSRVRRGERVGALGLRPAGIARSRMLTTGDKARIARVFTAAPRWKPSTLADRSAAAWFDELGLVGGAREFAEMLARTATYVVDMAGVSADLVAAQVQMALHDGVEYLHGGWSTMVDGLAGPPACGGRSSLRGRGCGSWRPTAAASGSRWPRTAPRATVTTSTTLASCPTGARCWRGGWSSPPAPRRPAQPCCPVGRRPGRTSGRRHAPPAWTWDSPRRPT